MAQVIDGKDLQQKTILQDDSASQNDAYENIRLNQQTDNQSQQSKKPADDSSGLPAEQQTAMQQEIADANNQAKQQQAKIDTEYRKSMRDCENQVANLKKDKRSFHKKNYDKYTFVVFDAILILGALGAIFSGLGAWYLWLPMMVFFGWRGVKGALKLKADSKACAVLKNKIKQQKQQIYQNYLTSTLQLEQQTSKQVEDIKIKYLGKTQALQNKPNSANNNVQTKPQKKVSKFAMALKKIKSKPSKKDIQNNEDLLLAK